MKRLTMRVTMPEWLKTPNHTFVDEADAVRRFMSRQTLFDDDSVYALHQYWGDSTAYADGLGATDHVLEYELVPGRDDTFFAYTEHRLYDSDAGIRAVLKEAGAFLEHPIVYPVDGDEERLTFVGEHEALRTIVESCPEEMDVTVERLDAYEAPDAGSRIAASLTERQREAIAVARDLGYYDVPRETDLEEVAARLDCSPGAVSQLLRRAESAVVGEVVD